MMRAGDQPSATARLRQAAGVRKVLNPGWTRQTTASRRVQQGRRQLATALVSVCLALMGCTSDTTDSRAPADSASLIATSSAGCTPYPGGTSRDLDGDGRADSVHLSPVRGRDDTTLAICRGDEEVHLILPLSDASLAGMLDLDGDGLPELVVDGIDHGVTKVHIVRAEGDGLTSIDLGPVVNYPADSPRREPFDARRFACADTDLDGKLELVRYSFSYASAEADNITIEAVRLGGTATRIEVISSKKVPLDEALTLWHQRSDCDFRTTREAGPERPQMLTTGWQRGSLAVRDGDESDDRELTGVAFSDRAQVFVAVGGRAPGNENEEHTPVAWVSNDGVVWAAASFDTAPGRINDAIAAGDGFLAVGTSQGEAAVWHSDAGSTWVQLDLPVMSAAGSSTTLRAVAEHGNGYVAVGSESDEVGHELDVDPVVWTSAEGGEWRRVVDPRLGIPGYQPPTPQNPLASMIDVAAAPGGGLVAVGEDLEHAPLVWLSDDGREWQASEFPYDFRIRGIAAARGRLFAYGNTTEAGGPTALVLWSTDGRQWDTAVLSRSAFASAIEGIAELPEGGLVAVGRTETDPFRASAATVWWSSDGSSWTMEKDHASVLGDPSENPYVSVEATASSGGSIVAVGYEGVERKLPDGSASCCRLRPLVLITSGLAS